MKYQQEFRDPKLAHQWIEAIRETSKQPWKIMEVCGGQTHSLLKHGIDQLLAGSVELIHGPGCPVCVTPIATIDNALAIAQQENVIFCSFGDMLRVPGSESDLLSLKAQGADIRIVYSPMDALSLAQEHPQREVVFFGVGFETTAPATALTVYQARQLNLANFSLLCAHFRVPPIIDALLDAGDCEIQGFLGAGHVCTVMGYQEYLPLAEQYRTPIVITGFEPVDLLQGIHRTVQQLETKQYSVENQYARVVKPDGNRQARELINTVFTPVDAEWRGLGKVADSGLTLVEEFRPWNAEYRFSVKPAAQRQSMVCRSGEVLKGLIKPPACGEFGVNCTPDHPLGATMVSSEGACAAYYHYRKLPHV